MTAEHIIETALANSFKNFHARGLDYICVKRTPEHTEKYYFFDGDVSSLPEVVNPHDHRYDFTTTVLIGGLTDFRYRPCAAGQGIALTGFEYRTPLNGGSGFSNPFEAHMRETTREIIGVNATYFSPAEVIHTIRPSRDQTIIRLDQYEDKMPLDDFTTTYVRGVEPPSMDGLYERFSEAEVVERLELIAEFGSIAA